jgi:1-acyl-sn-glycerol-3-phosphate acyltransferase
MFVVLRILLPLWQRSSRVQFKLADLEEGTRSVLVANHQSRVGPLFVGVQLGSRL